MVEIAYISFSCRNTTSIVTVIFLVYLSDTGIHAVN